MKELNASPGKLIQIGYEGEDKVTKIVFRYDAEWLACGDGVFKIRVLRHGDTEAYNATQVVDDREAMTLTVTVTDIELSVKGHGEMQVVYIGSDFVKKSPIYRYNVSRAIDSEVVNPPQGSIINELVQTVAGIGERLSTAETALEGKANTADVNTALALKANTDVATQSANGLMSSADKTKLDGLGNSGVSDVQVNGTSVVSNGVAEIPIADADINGVVRVGTSGTYGVKKWSNTSSVLTINSATSDFIKNPSNYGTANMRPITPNRQHESTFYGLAKAAGDTTQSASSNTVGTYTEDAKTAIRTMLGLEDMYQWYINNSGD